MRVTLLLALVGVVLVLATWSSVISTLVVPRRSRDRLSRMIDRAVDGAYALATRRVQDYASRDHLLASQASTTILVQLAVWLTLLFLGFALLLLPFDSQGFEHALAQSGSSLFTLGYAGPDSASLTVIDYVDAASGLVVVALQIGYLPTLYGAFNRRETEVTLLSSRAGSPTCPRAIPTTRC